MNSRALIAGIALAGAAPAFAVQVVFTTSMSGALEAPPNASPGTGFVTLTVDTDLMTMDVDVSFDNLLSATTIAHIHCCTAMPDTGTAAPATTVPSFPGFPMGVTSGSYSNSFDMSLLSSYNPGFVLANGGIDGAFAALVNGFETGTAYFNVHTEQFPGGEIRGFLHPIPEPETYALMLGGLAAVAWASRRGKSR